MDKGYQRFLQSGIDLTSVGIQRREDNTPYFCTPKGASIFGWAGVDGIHFCFIRGFGGMVFSVNPMAPSNYVHPLAKDFKDFLRLILACNNAEALEQAWMWDDPQFEAFLQANPPTQKQQQTLRDISEKMKLAPIEHPMAYIRELQSAFDERRIKYTGEINAIQMNPEIKSVFPEWKVYFSGNFWGHHGKDRAGKGIQIDRQFEWAGHHWVIPAIYSCSKGLVIDCCMQVDTDQIDCFMSKWNLSWENDSCETFTREQQMQIELDNPLCLEFTPRLTLNGKSLQASHGCSVCFNPCVPEGISNELEAKSAVEHYELEDSCGWVIYRNAFPWKSSRRPELRSLSLTMKQQPKQVPGPRIKVHAPGDSFTFFHPVSKTIYTLTVQNIEQQTIPQNKFGSDRWIYPTCYTAMSYTLSPEPTEEISLFDCAEGDKPLETAPGENSFHPAASSTCFVIGRIDSRNYPEKLHAACSSLHFEPALDDVEWLIVFNVRQFDEESFTLI